LRLPLSIKGVLPGCWGLKFWIRWENSAAIERQEVPKLDLTSFLVSSQKKPDKSLGLWAVRLR
jgi:hypothetical protein